VNILEINFKLKTLVDEPFSCRFKIRDGKLLLISMKNGGNCVLADEIVEILGSYAPNETREPSEA